ncbi:monothiol glutaredoxin-like protein-3 [Hyaloscypha bicolor E]|uniref:Monothiol glutaredoxin-like protein-3 n=1 Tax=Hyaloscypha bicolor E TaxID=1095630 RepID=A0A2J6T009_9HELO|nr:monothiol glutaredoxin-like protein-3 [Hyaloscypha bicolor E]PMD56347.1 monothiol glutaredoxin-like protein-3 [Hyaloscypha bicolor E]
MSILTELKSEEDWNKHSASLPSTTLQIIYFKAEWAAPCKQMTTVLQTLASSYPATDPLSTSWICMDAEEVIDVSDNFNVTAVPFLVLRRGDRVLETVSGSDATKVRTAIEKHAKSSGTGAVNGASITTSASATGANNLSTYAPTPQDPVTAPELSSSEVKEDKEALHKRLSSLVKAAPVMLFMKGTPSAPQCGFSRQLVALLRENSVKYGFFNILADDEVRQGLKEYADWPTFPQLWVEGELVGGLDIVKEEISNDPEFLKPFSVAKTPSAPVPGTA